MNNALIGVAVRRAARSKSVVHGVIAESGQDGGSPGVPMEVLMSVLGACDSEIFRRHQPFDRKF